MHTPFLVADSRVGERGNLEEEYRRALRAPLPSPLAPHLVSRPVLSPGLSRENPRGNLV